MGGQAQEEPQGLVVRLGVTQRLEYSDNPDLEIDGDSDLFGRTILDFGLESANSIDQFSLDLGTQIEEGRDDQSSIDVTNSFASVNYQRDTRNALLGLSFGYRESDTSSSFLDDFDIDGNVISQDSGTRETYRFGLQGEVGREAPVGASFDWSYTEIGYSGTSDPDLTDQSTNDIQGQVNFRISPRITTNLMAEYIDFDAQGNGTNRETSRLGFATELQIGSVLTANAGLSYDVIERSGDETGTDEGVSIEASLSRDLPNGSVGLQFSSDVASNDDGRRSNLSASWNRDLPRGDLSVEFGVTGADVIGTNPLLNVTYRYELPEAALTFGLSQNVNIDNDNEEQINTTLRASYDQRINNVSGIGVNLTLFDRNDLGITGNDGRRVDLSLDYSHEVTRDWSAVGGISHVYSTEDTGSDRHRTTVFVGLSREFSWSP